MNVFLQGCRLFSSSSLVHAHVKSLFLPGVEVDAALAHAAANEDAAEPTLTLTLTLTLNPNPNPTLTLSPSYP